MNIELNILDISNNDISNNDVSNNDVSNNYVSIDVFSNELIEELSPTEFNSEKEDDIQFKKYA